MLEVFFKVITIFCMVAIGFAANKKNVLPMEANSYLVNLLLVITSPCMIIGSMASETLTQSTFRLLLEILIGSAVFFCLAALVAFVLVKCLRCKDKEDEGVMMVIITSVNSGFMGFPVTKAIFGSTSFFSHGYRKHRLKHLSLFSGCAPDELWSREKGKYKRSPEAAL